MDQFVEHFLQIGFGGAAARAKSRLYDRCVEALGRPAGHAYFVPGRIEVLGKHTDYAGGRSVTCAADRGFLVAVSPRSDSQVMLHACDIGQRGGFSMTNPADVAGPGWLSYCAAVARRLASNFGPELRGADIAFSSDLPQASGMSSSSALVIASYMALDAANHFERMAPYQKNIQSHEDLAGYLATCENGQTFGGLAGERGVGTFGGSEDHTAILCSQPGRLNVYAYAPVRLERRVDWPEELAIFVASSGITAQKTGSAMGAYNNLSGEVAAIMQCLRAAGWDKPTLAAAIGDDPAAAAVVHDILAAARHGEVSTDRLLARFEQFAAEHQRIIPRAVDAIEHHDWITLGQLAHQSQSLADVKLGNQTPETRSLVIAAGRAGAIAASAFGAGFGGSVWAMVKKGEARTFARHWKREYDRFAGLPTNLAGFFPITPVGGAHRVF